MLIWWLSIFHFHAVSVSISFHSVPILFHFWGIFLENFRNLWKSVICKVFAGGGRSFRGWRTHVKSILVRNVRYVRICGNQEPCFPLMFPMFVFNIYNIKQIQYCYNQIIIASYWFDCCYDSRSKYELSLLFSSHLLEKRSTVFRVLYSCLLFEMDWWDFVFSYSFYLKIDFKIYNLLGILYII